MTSENTTAFPKDFVWGTAAASYQIEGAAREDGRGLSVWDTFCKQPGKIFSNNTGDKACDHYHKYEEDCRLMAQIGIKAYRLSISWPRVLPDGIGKVNNKGLDFYDRLIDKLLEYKIQPWVTLFHWDYPQSLFDRGGWLNPTSSDWFAEYTQVIVDKLSNRVGKWITLNEPQCFIDFGHRTGYHAPGLKLDWPDILTAAHNCLLAHGKAVQTIRSNAKTKPYIGTAFVGLVAIPLNETFTDIKVCSKLTFSVFEKSLMNNAWFCDPIMLGQYPADGIKLFGKDMPKFKDEDLKTIAQPLDFFGLNIYRGWTAKASILKGAELIQYPDGHPLTSMDWEVTPAALYWGPKFFYERYKLPIIITENGMANCDWVHLDGKVHDPQRIDFLSRYLSQLKRAINEGIICRGYFLWTIMDNFEWAYGYGKRFGIIYTDYSSQQRTLKDSAYWYKDIIVSNGKNL
ncbi:MAG: GH1 family beta-glucosidase [Sedimentisphaerales bacterium]